MKHKHFESSPYLQYKNFHIELNYYIKLSAAAIDNLLNESNESNFIDRLDSLVRNAKEKWNGFHISEPVFELNKLRVQLTKTGVMWVYSAFDVFLNHVHSLCSQKNGKSSIDLAEDTPRESKRLRNLFSTYNWDISQITYLEIVYNYYSLMRHCIVHNMGKASTELIDIAKSNEFKKAIENWPTVKENRKLSPPPEIDKKGNIELNPHHAITYSDVCYRISKEINCHILIHLGESYFILSSIKKNILDANHLHHSNSKRVYGYLKDRIKKEWKLDDLSDSFLREFLEENGIRQKVLAKYKLLEHSNKS
ncbi:MAG: hypothetical protein RLN88_08450 [Ekhidna sp.]|uniref:hypothetical protein n=1 Tax=Ekhidna sp. TaxID=2608089 RepID=UPI0032F03CD2